jgi:o-succinylbenzoate synthase
MGDPEHMVEQGRRAEQRGIRTFKLKVGSPGALDRELAAAERLRADLGSNVSLRLDANQSFSVAGARASLARLSALGLEYIEEPCAPSELPLLAELALPLALDESLAVRTAADVAAGVDALGIRALILKPTLLGGISGCCAWAEAARRIGAQVILSHAFEGPIGLTLSAALALSLGSAAAAHGLDLAGARLEHCDLPIFSGAHIEPWSEPGFGDWQSAG